MLEVIPGIAHLGGTIVMAALLLWYMQKRDVQTRQLAESGHQAVSQLSKAISAMRVEMAANRESLKHVCHGKSSVSD